MIKIEEKFEEIIKFGRHIESILQSLSKFVILHNIKSKEVCKTIIELKIL